jgi:hypothetical protein
MTIGHRIQGISGIAIAWGIAFTLFATAALFVGLAIGVVPHLLFGPRAVAVVAGRAFVAGAAAGVFFATLFAGEQRKRVLASLSPRRMAFWGFLGAGALPVISALTVGRTHPIPVPIVIAGTLLSGAIGGLMGAAMLHLARRVPLLRAVTHAEPETLSP